MNDQLDNLAKKIAVLYSIPEDILKDIEQKARADQDKKWIKIIDDKIKEVRQSIKDNDYTKLWQYSQSELDGAVTGTLKEIKEEALAQPDNSPEGITSDTTKTRNKALTPQDSLRGQVCKNCGKTKAKHFTGMCFCDDNPFSDNIAWFEPKWQVKGGQA